MDSFPVLPPPQGPETLSNAAEGAGWWLAIAALFGLFRTGNNDYKRRWRGL